MKTVGIIILIFFTITLFNPLHGQDPLSIRENGQAPSHNYDVIHYKLDIRVDEVAKSISGKTTITLIPQFPKLETVLLNAGEMTIKRVTINNGAELKFDSTTYMLNVHLDKSYSWKDTLRLTVEYSCNPKRGMTFYAPDSGYPNKRWQFWSQGEDTTNHFWFPCYDYPNDKATSEVIITVNKKFSALSNGKLLSVKENKKENTKTFHWKQSKPHSSYLVMIAGGEYAVLKDKAGKLPLEYYVYPDDTLNGRICFSETPKMIKFFNEKIGFDYPWEKYGQIILQDHFGGMENTGATTLSDNATVYDERVRIDESPVSLLAHELAHQWWGDVVTCRDFRHAWLNESFATYFDPLYFEHWKGRDEFDLRMYDNQNSGIWVDTARGRKPVVSEGSYGENIYPRGASILHMLRFLLGDELFWKSIKHYITKYQFQPVETNDFEIAIEEATGQNLYWFFDQWIYKAGLPIFNIGYTWSDSSQQVSMRVEQIQTMDSLTGVFRTPVNIEITTPSGSTNYRVNILTKDTTFVFPASQKPLLVVFDKGNWLLKRVKFAKSREEWKYQALHAESPISRLRALQGMTLQENNEEFIREITDRMVNDPFWAVRREAVNQSAKIKTADEAKRNEIKKGLMEAYKDKKSDVRNAAIAQLGNYKYNDVSVLLTKALEDSSYNVLNSALRALVKVDSVNAIPTVSKYLDYPSFRNRVANTALSALSSVDSVKIIPIAMDRARYGQPPSTRSTALGVLSKYGKGKPEIISFYKSLLNDKDTGFRSNAARTLGNIGDESVIPALEPIANDKENPASDAAKRSIEKLTKKPETKEGGK